MSGQPTEHADQAQPKKRFTRDAKLQASLGVLLQEKVHVVEGRSESLPVDRIQPDTMNPRYEGRISVSDIIAHRDGRLDLTKETGDRAKFFEGVSDLARSIESQGLLQPIVVREDKGGFRVIAGERRLLAHILIGRDRIRATVRAVGSEMEERSLRMVENLQRENLSFAELIRGVENLDTVFVEANGRVMDSFDLAGILNKHDSTCRRYLQIVRAPDTLRAAIEDGSITSVRAALIALGENEEGEGDSATHEPIPAKPASREGRRRKKITLGSIQKTGVMQALVKRLLRDEYEHRFGSIDWNDFDAVQQAWNDLLTEIEGEGESC